MDIMASLGYIVRPRLEEDEEGGGMGGKGRGGRKEMKEKGRRKGKR